MVNLPIAQYPDILPPEVNISAQYPGATAEVIAETVASPIEQAVNGVEDMLYMTSTASDAGTLGISVTFAVGTDPNQNTINVNNRVQTALARLPEPVRRLGVTVSPASSMTTRTTPPEWATHRSSGSSTTRCASGCGPTSWPSTG